MKRTRSWLSIVAFTGLTFVVAAGLAGCAGGSPVGEAKPQAVGQAATPARAGGQTFPKNRDGYADINVQQLADLLKSKDFWMVNVHIPYEGELRQTDLFIAYDKIGTSLDRLPAKDAPIVLYCRSGNMSTTAAKELVRQGYTNVMELDGGFNAWRAAGLEVIERPR